jgi:hypothetical protein
MRDSFARGVAVVMPGLIFMSLSGTRAEAQGSGSSRINQPAPARPAPYPAQPGPTYAQPQPIQARAATPEEFHVSLWRHLVREKAPYTRWASPPGKEGLRKAERPHGPLVRTYANAVAVADLKNLPPGSILILEDYAEGQKERTGIEVLYRVKGYDPKDGDWYWMKFREDGTVVRTPPDQGGRPIAGRVTSCIDCHRKAGGGDFAFSNDAAGTPVGAPIEKVQQK